MATTPGMTNLSSRRYAVPVACAAVAGVGTITVIGLADAVTEADGLAAIDPQFTANVVANRTPVLTALARGLTFVGDGSVRVLLALIATLLLWRWTHGGWIVAITWLALVYLVAYFSRKHPGRRSS